MTLTEIQYIQLLLIILLAVVARCLIRMGMLHATGNFPDRLAQRCGWGVVACLVLCVVVWFAPRWMGLM